MAKRGGLGRGLDALIPNKKTEKGSKENKKKTSEVEDIFIKKENSSEKPESETRKNDETSEEVKNSSVYTKYLSDFDSEGSFEIEEGSDSFIVASEEKEDEYEETNHYSKIYDSHDDEDDEDDWTEESDLLNEEDITTEMQNKTSAEEISESEEKNEQLETENIDVSDITLEAVHEMNSSATRDEQSGISVNSSENSENQASSAEKEPKDQTEEPVLIAETSDSDEVTTESEKTETEENNSEMTDLNNNLEVKVEDTKDDGHVIMMRISCVEPNRDQPRKYFDEEAIEELADSIRQFGVISPLLVQRKNEYYEIIAGERRWRAAKKAGLKEVPVIVREFSNQEAVEVALIDNIQREDLNPIEEAKAYNRLVAEYGLNQEEVAGRVSKSRSAVANSMRLLKLTEDVQKMLETGELSEGHARTLIPLPTESMQKEAAEQIVRENLSVRQTEKLVKEMMNPVDRPKRTVDERREALLMSLSENLKASLGTKVNIHQSGKNKGRIEIEYYSDEELDRLYELLRAIN